MPVGVRYIFRLDAYTALVALNDASDDVMGCSMDERWKDKSEEELAEARVLGD
jgi:hypothetical protein